MSDKKVVQAVEAATDIKVYVPKAEKVEKTESAKPAKSPTPKAGGKIKQVGTPATGRRKEGVARVRLVAGSGKVTVNGRSLEEYFANGFLQTVVNQPFNLVDVKSFDAIVKVHGGGLTGQAGAIRHGIARAIVKEMPQTKAEIKKAGFLTRDPRMKERKKYGLKKARRAPQFSKR